MTAGESDTTGEAEARPPGEAQATGDGPARPPDVTWASAVGRLPALSMALRVTATGLALYVLVAAGVANEFSSTARAQLNWVPLLAVAALVAVWAPPLTGRVGAGVATVLAGVGAGAAALGARRLEPGHDLASGGWIDETSRMLDHDLPPPSVYGMAIAMMLLAVVCAVQTLAGPGAGRRSSAAPGGAKRIGVGAVAGVLALAVLIPGTVAAAAASRTAADRRAGDGGAAVHRNRPAGQLRETSGPSAPTVEAWHYELPVAGVYVNPLAVPDWDVVLIHTPDDDVVALSKTSGDELWRYRLGPALQGIAVDPGGGRVLVVTHQAVVVLALDTGEQVAVRALPEELIGREAYTVTGPGATTVLRGSDAMSAVETATGVPLATLERPDGCAATPAVVDRSVLLISSGDSEDCAGHVVSHLDSGPPEPVGTVEPPNGARDLPVCQDGATGSRTLDPSCEIELMAADETVVANLAWSDPDIEGYEAPIYRDLVALSPGGDVLWRASDSLDATALPGDTALIQVTDREVVAAWNGEWHVLSLDDGRELARQPADELEGIPVDPRTRTSPCSQYGQLAIGPVADAEHIYTPCRDRLHIRRIDDLTTTTVDWPPTALAIEPAAGVVMAVDRDGITAFSDDRPQPR